MIYNEKQLTWNNITEVCRKYNIPGDTAINLATGWECSAVEANELFYSAINKELVIVSSGCEYWYENPDYIHLEILPYDNNLCGF